MPTKTATTKRRKPKMEQVTTLRRGPKQDLEVRAEIQQQFLKLYVDTRDMNGACNTLGIHPSTPWKWMKTDLKFKEQYEEARHAIGQHYMRMCDERAQRSDLLLIFTTKAFVPETRDKVADVNINANVNIAVGLLKRLQSAGPTTMLEAPSAH